MNTIRLVLLCGVLALTGCAGSAKAPAMFVLDADHGATNPPAQATRAVLVVEPVRVAPVLEESGIVYQTGAHRVVIANNNRWATPLPGQLRDALEAELADALPGVRVQTGALQKTGLPVLRLTTRVDAFMGHYDGNAHIAGDWQLVDASGQNRLSERFERRIPLQRDGYDALVDSLSRGWRASARDLAPRIQAILQRR